MTMGFRISLAFGAILSVLLVSSILSLMEFKKMSTHVSDLISENIKEINRSTELSVMSDEYNLRILSLVGQADYLTISGLDPRPYLDVTDEIIKDFSDRKNGAADSLKIAYDSYIAESLELDRIIVNNFVDTREWYFASLQPKYNEFRRWQDEFNKNLYEELHANSVSFDEEFYRCIVPGQVSIAVAIFLVLLMLFFLLVYYVRPITRMSRSIREYRQSAHPYRVTFEGDDELFRLNSDIKDIVDENISLNKRLRSRES